MNLPNCIFCQIIAGTSPAEIISRDDLITAFWDIRRIAPVHILIVPNRHIPSMNEIEPEDRPLLGHLLAKAAELAAQNGIAETGYRLVVNTGHDGGQSVQHLHLHLIGGRHLPFRFD
jgi:histidine triad (HIT) family protein